METDLVALTWNTAYPERSKWEKIGAEAQLEWRKVFAIYENLKAKSRQSTGWPAPPPDYMTPSKGYITDPATGY